MRFELTKKEAEQILGMITWFKIVEEDEKKIIYLKKLQNKIIKQLYHKLLK